MKGRRLLNFSSSANTVCYMDSGMVPEEDLDPPYGGPLFPEIKDLMKAFDDWQNTCGIIKFELRKVGDDTELEDGGRYFEVQEHEDNCKYFLCYSVAYFQGKSNELLGCDCSFSLVQVISQEEVPKDKLIEDYLKEHSKLEDPEETKVEGLTFTMPGHVKYNFDPTVLSIYAVGVDFDYDSIDNFKPFELEEKNFAQTKGDHQVMGHYSTLYDKFDKEVFMDFCKDAKNFSPMVLALVYGAIFRHLYQDSNMITFQWAISTLEENLSPELVKLAYLVMVAYCFPKDLDVVKYMKGKLSPKEKVDISPGFITLKESNVCCKSLNDGSKTKSRLPISIFYMSNASGRIDHSKPVYYSAGRVYLILEKDSKGTFTRAYGGNSDCQIFMMPDEKDPDILIVSQKFPGYEITIKTFTVNYEMVLYFQGFETIGQIFFKSDERKLEFTGSFDVLTPKRGVLRDLTVGKEINMFRIIDFDASRMEFYYQKVKDGPEWTCSVYPKKDS